MRGGVRALIGAALVMLVAWPAHAQGTIVPITGIFRSWVFRNFETGLSGNSANSPACNPILSTLITFADGDVNTGTEVITLNPATNVNGGLITGYGPLRLTSTGTLPAGLALATDYWIINVSASTVKLASSLANAIAGTPVNITAAAGGGTHTATGTNTAQGWTVADTGVTVVGNIRDCNNNQFRRYPTAAGASIDEYLPIGTAKGVYVYTMDGIERGGAPYTDRAIYHGLCDTTQSAAGVFANQVVNGCTTFVGFYKPTGSMTLELVSGSALGSPTLDGTGATVGTVATNTSELIFNGTDADGVVGAANAYTLAILYDRDTGVAQAYFNGALVGTRSVAANTTLYWNNASHIAVGDTSGHAAMSTNEFDVTLRTRATGEP